MGLGGRGLLRVGGQRGARWFREAGGVPPLEISEPSGRFLSLSEREEIACGLERGESRRAIGRRIGVVWSRGTIPLRERSMMTIALLAGLGNDGELALHLRSIPNTGTSRDDVMEALLHVAIYAGVPRANHAIALARRIFAEADAEGGQA